MSKTYQLHRIDSSIELPESCCNFTNFKNNETVTPLSGGRGGAYILKHDEETYVTKHYLRGGFAAKLLDDQYLWTGEKKTRPYREIEVTQHAYQNGLPVAQPIAYCIKKSGLFYQASIITRFVENQGTLADVLSRQILKEQDWGQLAKVISKMHDLHINHADLNADNILIGKDMSITLIDFDKAQIETRSGNWKQNNIDRLLRSLHKISPEYFSTEQWNTFLKAYQK